MSGDGMEVAEPDLGGLSVVVAGAGVIGLSCAWALARAGARVTVVDPSPGTGATHAAAGMLAPASEAVFGQESLLAAGVASLSLWPEFADRLARASGHEVRLDDGGTLVVATDADDGAALGRHARLLERHHCCMERLTSRVVRRLEPALSPRTAGGLLLPDERSVDPRAVRGALAAGAERLGVTVATGRATVEVEGGRATGVQWRSASGRRRVGADVVVAAAGWTTPALLQPLGVDVPVRPLKGQVLRLRAEPDVLRRTVRAVVHGREVYLVPRRGGEVVVGATTEDVGADTRVTAGGVHDLLHDAVEVVPEFAEAVLVEATARLRPATPDNLPVVGPTPVPGLVVAAGHGRDGVLLAPLTAVAVLAHVAGSSAPAPSRAFAPDRWVRAGAEPATAATSGARGTGRHTPTSSPEARPPTITTAPAPHPDQHPPKEHA